MTYILAPERDLDPEGAFRRYRDYLRQEGSRFPKGALALATSDWYFGNADHRAPHDSWLLSASFEEIGTAAEERERTVSLRVRLLGAYHDLELELHYPKVFAYSFRGAVGKDGHGDWRYDEFRLGEEGELVHEIQWWGKENRGTWVIHATDVVFTSRRYDAATMTPAP